MFGQKYSLLLAITPIVVVGKNNTSKYPHFFLTPPHYLPSKLGLLIWFRRRSTGNFLISKMGRVPGLEKDQIGPKNSKTFFDVLVKKIHQNTHTFFWPPPLSPMKFGSPEMIPAPIYRKFSELEGRLDHFLRFHPNRTETLELQFAKLGWKNTSKYPHFFLTPPLIYHQIWVSWRDSGADR